MKTSIRWSKEVALTFFKKVNYRVSTSCDWDETDDQDNANSKVHTFINSNCIDKMEIEMVSAMKLNTMQVQGIGESQFINKNILLSFTKLNGGKFC